MRCYAAGSFGDETIRAVRDLLLDSPLRGTIYGVALIVAVPLAWQAGQPLPAVFIGGISVLGMAFEVILWWQARH